MGEYGRLLDRGTNLVSERPELAAVPALAGLLAVGNVGKVVGFRGIHFGLKFPLPASILDVWSFVSVPSQGVSGPSAVPLLALPLFAAVRAVLAAGYLGAIHGTLAGEEASFVDGVADYVAPLVGFELLTTVAVLALFAPAMVAPLLVVLMIPALLVAGYLFWATPYLVVAAEESLVDALGHSYELASDGGRYLGFFVRFLLGGLALSVLATPLVVNLGLAGILLGTVLLAPVALALNGATMALIADLVDEDQGDGDPRGRGGDPPGRGRPPRVGWSPARPGRPARPRPRGRRRLRPGRRESVRPRGQRRVRSGRRR